MFKKIYIITFLFFFLGFTQESYAVVSYAHSKTKKVEKKKIKPFSKLKTTWKLLKKLKAENKEIRKNSTDSWQKKKAKRMLGWAAVLCVVGFLLSLLSTLYFVIIGYVFFGFGLIMLVLGLITLFSK